MTYEKNWLDYRITNPEVFDLALSALELRPELQVTGEGFELVWHASLRPGVVIPAESDAQGTT